MKKSTQDRIDALLDALKNPTEFTVQRIAALPTANDNGRFNSISDSLGLTKRCATMSLLEYFEDEFIGQDALYDSDVARKIVAVCQEDEAALRFIVLKAITYEKRLAGNGKSV